MTRSFALVRLKADTTDVASGFSRTSSLNTEGV
jgi:hypothetical protein